MDTQLNFIDIFEKRSKRFSGKLGSDYHDTRVTYKTEHLEQGKQRLYMTIGNRVGSMAGLKAGDRVTILRNEANPTMIALKKDPEGAKLCPMGVTGEDYHQAMGEVATCSLNVTIYDEDCLPYTRGRKVRGRWDTRKKLLVIDLPDDEVSITHIV